MTATPAQLGARALRKLGVAIVANANAPDAGPTTTADEVAALAVRTLGIVVPEADRPTLTIITPATDIAASASRAVGINPADPGDFAFAETLGQSDIATKTLVSLSVVAADLVAEPFDVAQVGDKVAAVHDFLVGLDYVAWPLTNVPYAAVEHYIAMASHLAAPSYGKPPRFEAYKAAMESLRMLALSGSKGQEIAIQKVQEVHDGLVAAGLVSWTVDQIPQAYAEDYSAMVAPRLAAVMGTHTDADSRKLDMDGSTAAEGRIRRGVMIAGAEARALVKVQAVHAELVGAGTASWTLDTIPAAMADAYATMAADLLGPEFGKEQDVNLYAGNAARVRQLAMGGLAGQTLAEQKVRAVHVGLDARGKTRWTLYDLPDYAEEPYVFMAATLLAPEVGVKADPSWWPQAEADLARIVSIPTTGRPVVACYF